MTLLPLDERVKIITDIHPCGSLAKLQQDWAKEMLSAEAEIPRQSGRIERAKRAQNALETIRALIAAGSYEAAIYLAFTAPEIALPMLPYSGTLLRHWRIRDREEAMVLGGKVGDEVPIDLAQFLPAEGKTDRARRMTGRGAAARQHGISDLNDAERRTQVQNKMNAVCKRQGMSRTKAWDEVETWAGNKRETLEKYGIKCPLPGRRGPREKLPPKT